MTNTTPCGNGCLQRADHLPGCGNPRCPGCLPQPADDGAVICRGCHRRLADWLTDIPDAYTLLADVIEPGTVTDNSGRPRGRRADAPAPLRLAVADATDTRRAWSPTTGEWTDNRRGIVGQLEAWANLVRDQRHLGRPAAAPTVTSEAGCLTRHLDWITAQDWVTDMYDELAATRRELGHAIGDTHPRPLGTCPAMLPDGSTCGETLWPGRDLLADGVACPACGATWDRSRLLLLGRVIGDTSEAS